MNSSPSTSAAAATGVDALLEDESSPVLPPSTRELLARHDAAQRALAKVKGRPTARTAGSALYGGLPTQVVFTDRRGTLRVSPVGPETGVSYSHETKLTADRLTAIVAAATEKQPDVTAFADRDTLRRVVAWSRSLVASRATQESRQVARQMEYRDGLPASAALPVLTEALASRHWLPAGLNAETLDGWATGFSVAAPTFSPDWFRALARHGQGGAHDSQTLNTLCAAERFGLLAASSGSTTAACSAYTRAAAFSDAHAALLAADPVLRERSMISGVVCGLRILTMTERSFTASVLSGFKLREGAEVWLFDDAGNRANSALAEVDFVGDSLRVSFTQPPVKDRGMVTAAKQGNKVIYATTRPFNGFRSAPGRRRWTAGTDEPLPRRDVPVDVVLAGAPTA